MLPVFPLSVAVSATPYSDRMLFSLNDDATPSTLHTLAIGSERGLVHAVDISGPEKN